MRDALAVVYPPFDEDFGYVTLESFLARKARRHLRRFRRAEQFVVDGQNGFVCEANPPALAAAVSALAADRTRRRHGRRRLRGGASHQLGRRHRETGGCVR